MRRAAPIVAALMLACAAGTTLAQGKATPPGKAVTPAAGFNADAVWPAPRAIVTRILNTYLERRQPDLARLPLVDRLQQALARTDLAGDFILKGAMSAEGKEPDFNAFRIVEEKTLDARRREIAVWTLLGKSERRLVFTLDVTSGDWLITDMHDGRSSLRQELQIAPTGLNLRPALSVQP